MVNACNVTVPYQTAPSLVVERISFMRAMGAIFLKKSEMKITMGHCAIFMCYQKRKDKKNAEPPLCCLNLIALWGMCSRKRQSLFNFQFCLPALSSSDLRLGPLGVQIVCLEQNQRGVAGLVQSLVQEEDSFSFLVFVCFSCETHTVRQRLRQLLPAATSHTQTHMTPRGRACQCSQKYK